MRIIGINYASAIVNYNFIGEVETKRNETLTPVECLIVGSVGQSSVERSVKAAPQFGNDLQRANCGAVASIAGGSLPTCAFAHWIFNQAQQFCLCSKCTLSRGPGGKGRGLWLALMAQLTPVAISHTARPQRNTCSQLLSAKPKVSLTLSLSEDRARVAFPPVELSSSA